MTEHYLSENIVIKEGQTFYQDKLVRRHNWHIKLEELGWEKLHKQWIKKLNKYRNPCNLGQPNNSLFGALECGDDGDCLFHCIATALNSLNESFYDSSDIRKLVAESITQEQFDDMIICYRSMKDLDDFDESWDPYEVTTLDNFRNQLMISGHNYWCDHLILQLVIQVFNLNIFILSQNEWTNTYEPYPMATKYDSSRNTIIVLHENGSHFKLIGHFQELMKTYFNHSNLPSEVKQLCNV